MTPSAAFRHWVLDPARTAEELYPVELLLATALHCAVHDGKCRPKEDIATYERDLGRRARRVRFLPCIDPALLDHAADWWDSLARLSLVHRIDRPVRDLALLRFLPQIISVDLSVVGADLAPLAALPKLETLTLRLAGATDLAALGPLPALHTLTLHLTEGRDLAPLGALRGLQSLRLTVEDPWPTDLAALAELPRLESVYYLGNLLTWAEVPALRAAHTLELQPAWSANTPLPSLAALGASRTVRSLEVGAVAQLAGAERFPAVETLGLAGPFRDLAPLAQLSRLAKLRLSGEVFEDLKPLLTPPRLRRLELNRQHGLLLRPLYKATNLREVVAPRCEVLAEELVRLNEHLSRVDPAVYRLPAPRSLAPLRFIAFNLRAHDYAALPPRPPSPGVAARAAAFGDDPAPTMNERRWMEQELQSRLEAVLAPGWGHVTVKDGDATVLLRRTCDIELLSAVVAAVREAFALARCPWECTFDYDPVHDVPAPEPPPTEKESEADLRAEMEETREYRRNWNEELKREHLARLGHEVPDEEDDEPADLADDADKNSAIPDDELLDDDEEEFDERDEYFYRVTLAEGILWAHAADADAVSHHLGQPAEDWHTLPEPPDRRPRYW
jgi:hypothetical protein